MKDSDGFIVKAGDLVGFSYGIPPVAVTGRLVEVDGELVLPTPGHTPSSARLKYLRRIGIQFYRMTEAQ